MFSFLKKLLGIREASEQKDHCGKDLQRGEKSMSARYKETAASKHSAVRRAPIDMAQGD